MVARRANDGGDGRALRVAAHPDARLRGHRALRAHGGCGVGRRAQGDVQLHRPQRSPADPSAGGHSADLPGVCRARDAPRPPAGEGVHDRADVPLRRAGTRPLPGALSTLARGDRVRRPRDRRGDHPALPRAAAPPGRHAVGAASELDRRCELSAPLRRTAQRMARRARGRAGRRRPAQTRDEPVAGVRREDPVRPCCARGRPEDRRGALRGLPGAFRRRAQRSWSATPSPTSSTRRSSAGSTTTPGRRSSSSAPTRTRTRRSAAAAATTGWSSRSAGRRLLRSASVPASSGYCSRSKTRASHADQPGVEVFFVVEDPASRHVALQALAGLRRAGVSADTDYAGRSFKGQMTQAGRSGARTVVIVRAGDATIRRRGLGEQVVALDEVVATLTT